MWLTLKLLFEEGRGVWGGRLWGGVTDEPQMRTLSATCLGKREAGRQMFHLETPSPSERASAEETAVRDLSCDPQQRPGKETVLGFLFFS